MCCLWELFFVRERDGNDVISDEHLNFVGQAGEGIPTIISSLAQVVRERPPGTRQGTLVSSPRQSIETLSRKSR